MFYFTRNKAVTSVETASLPSTNGSAMTHAQLDAVIEEARKKLYESITLRRTDICISLINEWFKGIVDGGGGGKPPLLLLTGSSV